MKLGRRSLAVVFERLRDIHNYKAFLRFLVVHPRPFSAMREEVFSKGIYPRIVPLRTPTGTCNAQLYSPADLSTLNLIFCRQDYYAPENTRIVVDIGANIGLSALYWLTRNNESTVYCYEPAPVSHERMLRNLNRYEGRVVAHRVAVSNFAGVARLGLEESGVYSSLDLQTDNSVECQVVHVNDVLEGVLKTHGVVDVLKIDSEGHELRTIEAIDRTFWKHIRCVNTDCQGASHMIPREFRHSRVSSAERFSR